MIADGRKIILFRQYVLKVDAWIPYHPGGDKAILHMVGRDATAEIEALHSNEAIQQMLRYCIGRVDGLWQNFTPPIQGGVFRQVLQEGQDRCNNDNGGEIEMESGSSPLSSRTPSPLFDQQPAKRRLASSSSSSVSEAEFSDGMSYLDAITRQHISLDLDKYPAPDTSTQARILQQYRELHQRILDLGLYECDSMAYATDCCIYVALFAAMFVCLHLGQYALGGLCLGFVWHQLVFAAHDAGHMGITHKYHVDSVIGIFIADFIGGLSMGWWKRSHNVHHIVTNAPEHDPDIEHMPLFAVSHRLLGSLRSTYYGRVMKYDAIAKMLLKVQSWTYFPFLALGRFNLYVLSWDHLLANRGPSKGPGAWHRWLELTGQIFFWAWFGYGILYCTIPNGWSRLFYLILR
ncbi:hypothetical protein CDD81_5805 [Ophiocordyceps australis]|uniref:Delta 8-(E)-sphingolipid desaturase n=1 Tax=Ophiocordyceps australis TaxID=1399860 RepID=A0A2C5XMQ6_9HYPO|nr:hypothetical protein CDD81_5805 [Ophiocordyceps australis]